MNVAVGSSRRFDWAMVAPVACLVALGVVMVYSSSAFLGASRYDSANGRFDSNQRSRQVRR